VRRIFIIGLSAALLAGCSAPERTEVPGAKVPQITGEVWKWVGTEGAGPASIERPARYTVEFMPDGRYSVRADCNSGAGSWSSEDETFRMAGGPMTLAACDEESLDARFLELLGQVSGAARDGDRLSLTSGDVRMVFEAMPALSIAGTAWLVHAVNNGREAVASVLPETELTIVFGADDQVAGSAGCNRFSGGFTVEAQTLSFSPLATTRMTCMGEGVVEQEQDFLAALSSVATWEIRGERAQLRTEEGSLAVDLVSAITGSAAVSSRQALPAEAVLTVQLQDVSRADAPALVLGETSVPLEGLTSPFRFRVAFDPAEIDERMSYALRATVRSGEELLFTTTGHVPVLTRDGGRFGVELNLEATER
jgi:heat shock protein HslJ